MSDLIEEIKSHRISEVISRFVHLKNSGTGRKKCCCPFHHEKTPSFHIDDREGLYHCFGCGAGGNVFTFIQSIKQCNFKQSLDYLCEILNIDKSKYEKFTQKTIQKEKERKTFYQAMEVVASYYKENLFNDKNAHDYIKTIRGIDNDSEKEFVFGLADDNLEKLINYCKLRDIDDELLTKCGIIKNSKNTDENNEKKYKYYLFFRNRIMIPIHNIQGKIVAFGGRIYKPNDNNAKYLNSSDNEHFKKGDILFNLNRAKKYIGKDKEGREHPLIIVEGYMDAISLWQYGFKTSVAPLGTSITNSHLQKIFNYCKNPIFVFDNDNAGQRATIRACEMIFPMLKTGFLPKICTLRGAKDVDEFLKKYSKDELQKQFDNAKEINQFIIDVNKEKYDLNNPNDLSIMQKNINNLTETIPDKILRQNYKNFFYNEFNNIKFNKHAKNNCLSRNNPLKFLNQSNLEYKKKNQINPFIKSVNLDYIEKQIISILVKSQQLQNDPYIEEHVIPKLMSKNQKLLSELNEKSDEQKQEFYAKYKNNISDKNVNNSNSRDVNCNENMSVLSNIIIQWKLTKIDNSNLEDCVKSMEKKKILEKKKKILQSDTDY